MGRRAGFLHSVRRLKAFAVGFALVLVIASAYGAGKGRTVPVDSGYVRMGTNAQGGTVWGNRVQFKQFWENALGGAATSTITRTTPLSSNTLGSLARRGLRGGGYAAAVSLAIEGVIDLAGWSIGELQDQVMMPGSGEAPQLGPIAYCIDRVDGNIDFRRCSDVPGQLAQIVPIQAMGACQAPAASAGTVDGVRHMYTCANGYSMIEQEKTMPTGGWPPAWPWGPGIVEPRQVTDEELGDAIRDRPDIVNPLLKDPRTGGVIITPELKQLLDDLQQELKEREGLTDDVGVPGETGPDEIPDGYQGEGTDGSQTELEFPVFCTWASYVCDFIDWMKVPEPDTDPPPDPWVEEPEIVQQEWSSGLGGGSCPSAAGFSVSIGTYSQNVEFSYTPLCQAATWIRAIAIPLCGLLAVFIVGGYRRSANA